MKRIALLFCGSVVACGPFNKGAEAEPDPRRCSEYVEVQFTPGYSGSEIGAFARQLGIRFVDREPGQGHGFEYYLMEVIDPVKSARMIIFTLQKDFGRYVADARVAHIPCR